MTSTTEQYDVLIVGQGAAAFAAALYAARYQMKIIVIGEMFGGETATGGLSKITQGTLRSMGMT